MADDAQHAGNDQLGEPLVHGQGEPIILVKIADDDVHAYIDGVEAEPGSEAWLDPMCAIGLVQMGQARIIGSRTPDEARPERERREAAAAKAVKAPKADEFAGWEKRLHARAKAEAKAAK